jgi:hypothetical protein
MPSDVRAAYDRAVDDPGELHSGARLAAKLKAKIIVNGNEFNHPGEMSVDDRHSYHEALDALFAAGIAASRAETPNIDRNTTSSRAFRLRDCLSRIAKRFWRS